MFLGEYRHQIDAKNRLRVPAKLKSELGDKFVVTKGSNGCLFVFNSKTMESLYEKLQNVPISDIAAQRSIRMLFSSASEVENDEQGRFLLPQSLKAFAKIDKNVVTVGAGTRIEIWSEEVWNEYNSYDNFDEVLEGLGKFGV
ncbi:MAG: division/cell wall cluster transcriptional repressor MraZ [Clostridia bacterium]|nr:division/cell wall cluster transcriptional repressor MraZ [Clostridia bacterium]